MTTNRPATFIRPTTAQVRGVALSPGNRVRLEDGTTKTVLRAGSTFRTTIILFTDDTRLEVPNARKVTKVL